MTTIGLDLIPPPATIEATVTDYTTAARHCARIDRRDGCNFTVAAAQERAMAAKNRGYDDAADFWDTYAAEILSMRESGS